MAGKVKPADFGCFRIDMIGDSSRKATVQQDGEVRMTYHDPKQSGVDGVRGELIPGLHRARQQAHPLLTGERQGSSTLIYNGVSTKPIAEYRVKWWQGGSEGGELHVHGRLIRWTRKSFQFEPKIKLYEGDVHLASLKMEKSLFSGLKRSGDILWHTDKTNDQELVLVIVYVAAKLVLKEIRKDRKGRAAAGAGIGAGGGGGGC